MLGYFSIIGLLRVHVLLGDFTLALKVMENVELNQKVCFPCYPRAFYMMLNHGLQAPFTRVTACHVATYYYVGFCYIMLRRYPDAIRSFVTILNFILRMRQYHTRSYQYDQVGHLHTRVTSPFTNLTSQISKTADRMYALFAICNVLSPSRLDDNISNIVKERYSEQLPKMSSRNSEEAIPAFEELFLYACPKFMSANPPPYDDPAALSVLLSAEPQPDPARRHLGLFLADVKAQAPVPTLRSFLKLYTSLDAKKLANFLDADEESMVQQMMAMKVATRSVSRVGNETGLLEGTTISTSDLNFVINEVRLPLSMFVILEGMLMWFPSAEHGSYC
jgi:translation initiation factor 3 subunit L